MKDLPEDSEIRMKEHADKTIQEFERMLQVNPPQDIIDFVQSLYKDGKSPCEAFGVKIDQLVELDAKIESLYGEGESIEYLGKGLKKEGK